MLPHSGAKKSPQSESRGERSGGRKNKKGFDDHSKWGGGEENNRLEAVWKVRIKNAAEVVAIREKSLNRGLIPLAAQRLIKEFGKSQLDWRIISCRKKSAIIRLPRPTGVTTGIFSCPILTKKTEK